MKAIQRGLRELRREGLARSVPHGEGSQLGWLLTTTTHRSEPAPPKSKPSITADPPRSKLTLKPANRDGPRLGMQGKVLKYLPREPAVASVESIAQHIEAECHLEAGQPTKAVAYQLADLEKKKLATGHAHDWSRIA